jgi:hypothetical protein
MTSITRRLFLSLAASLAPASAIAHHGWGGYDTSKSFTVTGRILKSTFENPHCEIEMEVDSLRGRNTPPQNASAYTALKLYGIRPGQRLAASASINRTGNRIFDQDFTWVTL